MFAVIQGLDLTVEQVNAGWQQRDPQPPRGGREKVAVLNDRGARVVIRAVQNGRTTKTLDELHFRVDFKSACARLTGVFRANANRCRCSLVGRDLGCGNCHDLAPDAGDSYLNIGFGDAHDLSGKEVHPG